MVSPSNHVLVIPMKHTYVYPLLLFFHYSYFIQEQILLIVHSGKSMICRVYSVRIRHVIIHNAYTCTSHLTYKRIAYFVNIHTGDLYVNGWGGCEIYFVSLSRISFLLKWPSVT